MTARTDGPSAAVRIRVYKRDKFTCTYCGVSGQEAELEVDHIIAVAKGGSHHISNLTTACRACNQAKGSGAAPPRKSRADTQFVAKPSHPLAGKFIHTFKDGKLRWQGHILDVDGDMCLVQLFEWLMGDPTNIEKIPKSEIYSDNVKIYADREVWVESARRIERKEDLKTRLGVGA